MTKPTERPTDRTVREEWRIAAEVGGHEWPCREVGGAEDCDGAGCFTLTSLARPSRARDELTGSLPTPSVGAASVNDDASGDCDAETDIDLSEKWVDISDIVWDTAQPKPQDDRREERER